MREPYELLLTAAKNVVAHPRSLARLERLKFLVENKKCAKCYRYRPIDEFGKDLRYFDNKRPVCNKCRTRHKL